MPSPVVLVEIALGVLLALAVLAVLATFARRRIISGGSPLMICGYRPMGATRWRLGYLKFAGRTLEWYPLGGVSFRPFHRWSRGGLLLDMPQVLPVAAGPSLIPGAVGVPCSIGAESFELAVPQADYTALRAWQEAAPPGQGVGSVA